MRGRSCRTEPSGWWYATPPFRDPSEVGRSLRRNSPSVKRELVRVGGLQHWCWETDKLQEEECITVPNGSVWKPPCECCHFLLILPPFLLNILRARKEAGGTETRASRESGEEGDKLL
ncbi:hypothetical protein NDU88_003209 [Pleurodeles waltl]|uniref:Uncharacterized protein n=1 Tax=Pleurodeles waltl TaxID=8319 RepID=A0AAV7V1W2_PLEWA|nr:hypothetical protein NDU88_003209 [Pleurodeles waltl]